MSAGVLQLTRYGKTQWVHGACDTCGAVVVRTIYAWNRAEHHYCSARCAGAACHKRNTASTTLVFCHQCHAPIDRAASHVNEGHNFCNCRCFGHWKAGRSPLDIFCAQLTADRIAQLEALRDEKRILERLLVIYGPPVSAPTNPAP